MLLITPIYASLLTFLFLWLSYRVVQGRRIFKVSVGDGEEKDLRKRMRVQANCAEYGPLGIILLAFAELQGMPGYLVHVFGTLLILGRVAHAIGMGSTPQVVPARVWGMYLTVGTMLALALANLFHAIT